MTTAIVSRTRTQFTFQVLVGIQVTAMLLLLITNTVLVVDGQGFLDCPQRIKESCSGFIKTSDPVADNPVLSNNEDSSSLQNKVRVACCSAAAVQRCIRRVAAETCPSIPIESAISMVGQLVPTPSGGGACDGYMFWSPECLYTNYMIEILGAGAATGLVLLALLVVCCCCCCRGKK